MKFKFFLEQFIHPEKDDWGNDVHIVKPHSNSHESTWHDANKIDTFTPNSRTPSFSSKLEPDHEFIEPEYKHHPALKQATGILIHNGDGRVVVVSPSNRFGGYTNTFPKGRTDGQDLKTAAKREAYEESGAHVKLTGHLGDYDRSTTRTRYYTGERIGGDLSKMGWESQAVHLVPIHQLHDFMDNAVDKQIAKDY